VVPESKPTFNTIKTNSLRLASLKNLARFCLRSARLMSLVSYIWEKYFVNMRTLKSYLPVSLFFMFNAIVQGNQFAILLRTNLPSAVCQKEYSNNFIPNSNRRYARAHLGFNFFNIWFIICARNQSHLAINNSIISNRNAFF